MTTWPVGASGWGRKGGHRRLDLLGAVQGRERIVQRALAADDLHDRIVHLVIPGRAQDAQHGLFLGLQGGIRAGRKGRAQIGDRDVLYAGRVGALEGIAPGVAVQRAIGVEQGKGFLRSRLAVA